MSLSTDQKSDYLTYLHAFRGVAILSIVGAHAWSILTFTYGGAEKFDHHIWLYSLTETLFHGSTLFFALISGLLFTRVLRQRGWSRFYRSKLTNVLLPYVVIASLITLSFWNAYLEYAIPAGLETRVYMVVLENLVTGRAQMHFWYMPILFGLFAVTPFIYALLKGPGNGIGAYALVLLPMFVSRTIYPDFLSFNTFVYFLGAYTFGMLLGDRLETAMALITRYRFCLLAILIASTVTNFLLFFWVYVPGEFVSLHQSVIYLQKLVLALLLLHWMCLYESRLPTLLLALGTYAFTIYFVHFYFMYPIGQFFAKTLPGANLAVLAAGGLLIYIVGIGLSLLTGMFFRRILGKYSRMIVGA